MQQETRSEVVYHAWGIFIYDGEQMT
jgi:hypothetical protein